MAYYYASKYESENCEYILHDKNCINLPDMENRIYVGNFETVKNAIEKVESWGCIVRQHCQCENCTKIHGLSPHLN